MAFFTLYQAKGLLSIPDSQIDFLDRIGYLFFISSLANLTTLLVDLNLYDIIIPAALWTIGMIAIAVIEREEVEVNIFTSTSFEYQKRSADNYVLC
ncbi:hypothetical protein MWH28_09420 [Natroniella sulfidigena]|uniref:hypothetical protein n=1 Tax=Natroniella sulfidigena TaxID=723921 RepID=UPI002009F915|nr:hypothetical protein [Natroniella sulfidigena]MCK8817575.1 hypothetical protein [Natroniella sulfidigena]